MLTFKELKLITNNFTDFSNINLLNINPQSVFYLPQEQKNLLFIERAKLVHGNKYNYSKVVYVNNKTKIEIICPIHGSFWQIPSNHMTRSCCKKCSAINSTKLTRDKITKTTEQFIIDATKIHGNYYNYSKVVYINSYTKVEIVCPIHGSFWQIPADHLRDYGCPMCSTSHGELMVSKILRGNRLKFETQWHFNKHTQLRGKGSNYFSFDFYLPEYNLCIEYDGIQHYIQFQRYGGIEGLNNVQQRDQLKNQFCLDNNIKLLRIPYWIKPTDTLILFYLNKNFTIVNNYIIRSGL